MWMGLLMWLGVAAVAAEPTPLEPTDYAALRDGLRFSDLVLGEGEEVFPGSRVRVHFETWLKDGTPVYSSRDAGDAFTFNLGTGEVIEGWNRGLLAMRVGGKRQLVVPAELAYGAVVRGVIPANSTLIYEVELVGVGHARVPPPHPDVRDDRLEQGAAGVRFRDLTVGRGPKAQVGTTILIEATSWRADGSIIKSTLAGDAPRQMKVGDSGTEPWLEITLLDMMAGSTRALVLPASAGKEAAVIQVSVVEVEPIRPSRGKRANPEPIAEADLVQDSSGLRYADLVVGEGVFPVNGQIVVCRYTGWVDGKPLDSSYDRGQPFEFQLGRGEVVRGWEIGVSTMKVGGVRQLHVAPFLGYGRWGQPPRIKRDSQLVFEIELVEIKPGH